MPLRSFLRALECSGCFWAKRKPLTLLKSGAARWTGAPEDACSQHNRQSWLSGWDSNPLSPAEQASTLPHMLPDTDTSILAQKETPEVLPSGVSLASKTRRFFRCRGATSNQETPTTRISILRPLYPAAQVCTPSTRRGAKSIEVGRWNRTTMQGRPPCPTVRRCQPRHVYMPSSHGVSVNQIPHVG